MPEKPPVTNPEGSVRPAAARRPAWHALSRRGWSLWAVTFMVVLSLATTVPVLYWIVMKSFQNAESVLEQAYIAIVGLAGLVLLFCLYMVLKQLELEQARAALASEEREKEDIRTRLSELTELFRVSTALNLRLNLDVILEIIVRRVVCTPRAQQSSIMIYNPETGMIETRASYGLESEYARHARKRLGEGIAGWVAERQEAVLLNAQNAPDTFVRHYKANRNITSALSLPLRVGDRCVGVLNVNRINHPETFREHHREILRMFAEHVGAVIDRAEQMDRLTERNRELESDVVMLSESGRLKDVFLSTASHELKTPLTAVIAYAELLGDHERRLDDRQRSEFVARLRGEAQRLLGLIEEILDLSRIEAGRLPLKRAEIDLRALAHDAVETSRALAGKFGIRLLEDHEESVPRLWVDEVKLRQAVVNLIVNAIKFSPANGEVRIRVMNDAGSVRIEVTDRGPGIAPEDTVHLFQLFGQGLRERAENRGGLGIGLHLVKRLTELHGGHVGVNSTVGEGSTFWMRLPITAAAGAEESPGTVPADADGSEKPEGEERAAA